VEAAALVVAASVAVASAVLGEVVVAEVEQAGPGNANIMQQLNWIGGKLFWILIFASGKLSAQTYSMPLFRVVHQVSNITNLHIPDQPITIQSQKSTQTSYRLLTPVSNYFELEATTENISGSLFAFGREDKFNSNDTAGLQSAEQAWLMANINKPRKMVISRFHAKGLLYDTIESSKPFYFEIEEDPGKYFLPFDKKTVKAGLIWSDSTVQDSSRQLHQYIITKIIDRQVFVSVLSDWFIKNKLSQLGKSVLQQFKGIARTERVYDLVSGIMQSESMKVKLSGSSTMEKEVLPVTIELSSSTTVSLPTQH